ncbi:hypothetical protein C5167_000850 [Papaver somniferum]|uniref:Uncharacterized protein n=1 Tax=Papaver somniferum TaxID=3469 RepID=A0A4Y7KWD6_PAPSO|nr:hypothetical protein C5167_000850 [Papaver somniferum]
MMTIQQQLGGSKVVAYAPTSETDYTGARSSAKYESISGMTVYKEESHEELRWEDHQLGCKVLIVEWYVSELVCVHNDETEDDALGLNLVRVLFIILHVRIVQLLYCWLALNFSSGPYLPASTISDPVSDIPATTSAVRKMYMLHYSLYCLQSSPVAVVTTNDCVLSFSYYTHCNDYSNLVPSKSSKPTIFESPSPSTSLFASPSSPYSLFPLPPPPNSLLGSASLFGSPSPSTSLSGSPNAPISIFGSPSPPTTGLFSLRFLPNNFVSHHPVHLVMICVCMAAEQ